MVVRTCQAQIEVKCGLCVCEYEVIGIGGSVVEALRGNLFVIGLCMLKMLLMGALWFN